MLDQDGVKFDNLRLAKLPAINSHEGWVKFLTITKYRQTECEFITNLDVCRLRPLASNLDFVQKGAMHGT